MGSTNPGT
jgi:tetratricopeptide (TPR) repeat protein